MWGPIIFFAIFVIVYLFMCGSEDEETRKKGREGVKAFSIGGGIVVIVALILIICTKLDESRNKEEWEKERKRIEMQYRQQLENINKKDSIDNIIEQRSQTEFNGTIFAEIKLGEYKNIVEQKLRNKKNEGIRLYDGDSADVVYINDYDVVYHNDKLACLILYSEQDELSEEIYSYYLLKYGKTKSGNWKFSNYEIDISAPTRKRYDPQAEAGYKSSPPYLYFDSFRGEKTNRITQDMSFIRIMYKNLNLLKEIERDYENTISNGIEGMIQLKKYGIISEEEFTSHKKRLIENHY